MLKILKTGFYTSVQDVGRFGFRDYGVPVSGCMDGYSSAFANVLLGNNKNDAVLEMTMVGGEFQFLAPTIIAISGADMSPRLNSKPISNNLPIAINQNDVLSFGNVKFGIRTYLAVKNGFKSSKVLGSRSYYVPITETNIVSKGDIIPYDIHTNPLQKQNASIKYNDELFVCNELSVFKGPEFDELTAKQKKVLLNEEFKVSKNNNRMAYQLETSLKNNLPSILTAPVLPGTVQLAPSGNLIVLMRDGQTTGGYPRVLQHTENSINILSQKSTTNGLKFRLKE